MINAGKDLYVERNYEMIDNSNYGVIYYYENYMPPRRKNSRRDLFDYAIRKAVNIVNVFSF